MTSNLVQDREEVSGRIGPAPEELRRSAPAVGRRRWRALAFGTVALALAAGVAWVALRHRGEVVAAVLSFGRSNAVAVAAPRPPMVRTATVAAASGRDIRFTGVVHARYESALGFRVSGKIVERLVDVGDHVHKDQPLARLDTTDFVLALRAAHAAAAAARATATQTASDETRGWALVNKGQLSVQAYEREKTARDSAAANLASALAQERQAENQAAYAVLLADADGIVMQTSGEPGQVVATGQAVVRLARDGAREAEVYIPEGETATEKGSAALYARPHLWFPAKLREISSSADPQTRTFRARYVLEDDGRNAALGTTVTVRVPTSTPGPASVSVPAGALFDDGNGPKVWVVDRASSTVTARSIRILQVGDEDAVVAGDLKPGERVVALGAHLLAAGEKVGMARTPIDTAGR